MQNRNIAWFATPALILLIAGLIWAVVTPRASPDRIATRDLVVEVGQPTALSVGAAGTAVLLRSATRLEILSAVPNLGYTPKILVSVGRVVEVEFTSDTQRIVFTAVLADDEVTVSTTVEANPDTGVLATTTSSFTRSLTSASTSTITTTRTSAAPSRTTAVPSTTTSPSPPAATTAPTMTTTTTPTTTAAPTTTTIAPTTTTIAPTTTTIAPTTTTTVVPVIPDGVVIYSLGPAGTITVTFLNQKFVEGVVNAASGWRVDKTDGDSNDIRVELVHGDLRTIWEARIQNGQVTIDLRTVEDD